MSKFKSKSHAEHRLKKLYKFNDVGLANACVYCGDKNDNPDFSPSIDYVPSLNYTVSLTIDYLSEMKLWMVPSCDPCIEMLGNSHETTLVDRRDIVADTISKKYRRLLARGKEISEHKYDFSTKVRDQQGLRIFNRWMFATITTKEIEIENIEPVEEYQRSNFSKRLDKEEISYFLWLISWGVNERTAEIFENSFESGMPLPKDLLSNEEIIFLEVGQQLAPLIGPFGFAGSPDKYVKKVRASLNSINHPAAKLTNLGLDKFSTPKQKIEKLKLLLKTEVTDLPALETLPPKNSSLSEKREHKSNDLKTSRAFLHKKPYAKNNTKKTLPKNITATQLESLNLNEFLIYQKENGPVHNVTVLTHLGFKSRVFSLNLILEHIKANRIYSKLLGRQLKRELNDMQKQYKQTNTLNNISLKSLLIAFAIHDEIPKTARLEILNYLNENKEILPRT
ncbi:hypothetical protein SPH72_15355 [Rhodobacterales bacterium FZCC0083]|nr:hypothetical protein SPH72_15355 [Rhodobacterales bacterium FZCC0083]